MFNLSLKSDDEMFHVALYEWLISRNLTEKLLEVRVICPHYFLFSISINYRPQRSCGQGNIFTPVCHSVHRGVCLSACWDTSPPLPPTPYSKHPPPGSDTPLPGPDTTPPAPLKQTPAYGLRAAGTHPTGMHSCCIFE